MGRFVLALDFGTSFLHCLLAHSSGRPIRAASWPISYFTPEGCPPLAREYDPETILEDLGQLVEAALKGTGAEEISAVGLTAQRQGMVFLDEAGRELYCGPNLDLRAMFEGAAMDEQVGPAFYATTGHHPCMLFGPARLRWFRDNRPAVYERVATVLTIGGWLAYRLTGEVTSEPCLEAEAGLLDIRSRERPLPLLDELGVPDAALAPLLRNRGPAGRLTSQVADRWGLEAGIPVYLVGPDTQCGLLGMGLDKEGMAGAVLGWSGAIQVLTSRPCYDDEMRTWTGLFPLDRLWVAEANMGVVGGAYRWLKDTLVGTDASFEAAESLAVGASAAPDGVAAFLGPGPVSSFKAGLRLGGLVFPTPLSFQETSPGQLLRASIENVAYSTRANHDVLREVAGLDIRLLYLGGGMSRSHTLASALADVLGLPVRLSSDPHVSARGAARGAALASDPSLDPDEAREAARDFQEIEPGGPSVVAQQQEQFQQWLDLYARLGPG